MFINSKDKYEKKKLYNEKNSDKKEAHFIKDDVIDNYWEVKYEGVIS